MASYVESLQYQQDEVLIGHTGPVNSVCGTIQKDMSTVVSASSDLTVKVWKRNETTSEQFQLLQTLSSESGFILGIDICCLHHQMVMACATDVGKVEIFVEKDKMVGRY